MIRTLSLCPTCYKKIPAEIIFHDGSAWMLKTCDQHGQFSAQVERDASFFSAFYREGTLGRNNSIIVHSYDKCNLSCKWCYYPGGQEQIIPPEEVDQILGLYRGKYAIMMSGGEPTIDPEFLNKVKKYSAMGWPVSAITNMVKLADEKFFAACLESPLRIGDTMNFACSVQHPKNHSLEASAAKFQALHNFEVNGIKPACVMFSIESLEELDYIKEFYDRTKGFYPMIRIRTMFRNWQAKGIKRELFLSDLYKAFIKKFECYLPTQDLTHEHSNLYCLYMKMEGCTVSLSSAPSVEDVDYHQCSRPVYMLARDRRCYPVPLAQIINEGISLGWKDGFRLQEVQPCLL